MNKSQFEIAQAVRLATEKRTRLKSLKNRCALASTALHILWTDAGIESKLMSGWYVAPGPSFGKLVFGCAEHILLAKSYRLPEEIAHSWVECGRQIWDLTLTQFEPAADPISRLRKPDPRYRNAHPVSPKGAIDQLELIGVGDLCKKVMAEAVELIRL